MSSATDEDINDSSDDDISDEEIPQDENLLNSKETGLLELPFPAVRCQIWLSSGTC